MDEIIFRIAEENSNVRLDTFISQNTDFSRNSVQMLIDENRISVNGRPEKKNYKTRLNDEITVSVPPLRDVDILPENIPLDIYYEDEYLLAPAARSMGISFSASPKATTSSGCI